MASRLFNSDVIVNGSLDAVTHIIVDDAVNGRITLEPGVSQNTISSTTTGFAAWKNLRIQSGASAYSDFTSSGLSITGTVSATRATLRGPNTIPALGSSTRGGLSIGQDSSDTYGIQLGSVYSTGDGWIQASRWDGTATAYSLLLQPNGGNVGIGTTTPSSLLGSTGTLTTNAAGASGVVFKVAGTDIGFVGANATDIVLDAQGTRGMSLQTNGANRFYIKPDGNIGVGQLAPDRRFYVADPSNSQGTFLAYNLGASFTGTVAEILADRASSSAYNLLALKSSTTTQFLVRGDGNVGIRTSTPGASLDVLGASGDQLRLRTASSEYYRIGRNSSTGALDFWGSQAGYPSYTFGGVDGTWMTINASGRVGIKTTAPYTELGVNGNAIFSGTNPFLALAADQSGATPAYIQWLNSSGLMDLACTAGIRMRNNTVLGGPNALPLSGGASASWLTLDGSTYSGGIVYSANQVVRGYTYATAAGTLTHQAVDGLGQQFIVNGSQIALTLASNAIASFVAQVNIAGSSEAHWNNQALVTPSAYIAHILGVDQTAIGTGCYQDTYGGGFKYRGSYGAALYKQLGNSYGGPAHQFLVEVSGTRAAGNGIGFLAQLNVGADGVGLGGIEYPKAILHTPTINPVALGRWVLNVAHAHCAASQQYFMIKTKVPFLGNDCPLKIRVTGFSYVGEMCDLDIQTYIYNNEFYALGSTTKFTSRVGFRTPSRIRLGTWDDGGTLKVAIEIANDSIYWAGYNIDLFRHGDGADSYTPVDECVGWSSYLDSFDVHGSITNVVTVPQAGGVQQVASGALHVGAGLSARLGVRGTTSDSSAYAFEAINGSGTGLLTVRNDGAVAIGPGGGQLTVGATASQHAYISYNRLVSQVDVSGTTYASGFIDIGASSTSTSRYVGIGFRQDSSGSSLVGHAIGIRGTASGTTNVSIFGLAAAGDFQGGAQILFLYNGTAPTGNPSGGVFIWAENGALKARGSAGTVTTMAQA